MFKMRYVYCRYRGGSSMLLLSTLAFINFAAIFVGAKPTAVVTTSTGPVRGEILTTVNSVNYASFRGIRYAKPPLGYLRFKPPIAIDPWTETLNATTDGEDCIQGITKSGAVVGSEDCLFLNIQTPVTNLKKIPKKSLKPVMVWIYGGAFAVGSSSSKVYRPDYLLEKGVVYVAFNYRIGALGFLSLQHPNATGNVGLKDQVLALKWVRANIKKFGGDPNNITIFGESAGSASVGYHILSDASAGLFQAAISMSGVPLNPWAFNSPAKALSRAQLLGAFLGTVSSDKDALLETFYNATAKEIVEATSKIPLGILSFLPTLEDESIATGAFLTKCSVDKYNSGNFTKVPQMLGFLDKETIAFAGAVEPFIQIFNQALRAFDDYGLELPDNLALVKSLIDKSTDVLAELGDAALGAVVNVTTDAVFIAQIDQTQKILATENNGSPVYYYHISFYTNASFHNLKFKNDLLGPGHADDLAYVFYYPELRYNTDPNDPVRRTIDRVTTMWTNFAKYGNPTPYWDNSVGITWPNSGRLGRCLDIGTELKVGLRPTNANTQFIQTTSRPLLRTINGC